MDAHLTAGADVLDEDQAVKPDPEAPYGRKPDGTPYKRDPAIMRALQARRFSGGKRNDRSAPKPAKVASRPAAKAAGARVDTAKTKAYGAAAARYFLRATDAVLRDPVERAIMRRQAVDLALIVDKLLQEDARILAWIDRLKLRLTGGAKGELVGWTVSTALLFALHRGYKHPVLEMMFRTTLDQVQVEAIAYERAQEQERAEMLRLLQEYEREEAELLKTYADAPMRQPTDYGSATSSAPIPPPFAQFNGGGG